MNGTARFCVLLSMALFPFFLKAAPIQAQTSTRVITLAPHITEMVFAAGAGHTIVGTVVSSNHPKKAHALPKVGDGATNINIESVAALTPNLVLAWQDSGAVAANKQKLELLGIKIAFVAPTKLDDIPLHIEQLGQRLGSSAKARATAERLQTRLDNLRREYAHRTPLTAYIEIGHSPLYAAGNDALLNEALRICGATNVFGDSRLAAVPIGPEHILHQKPDVIIVARRGTTPTFEVKKRLDAMGLSGMMAVFSLDPDKLFRPGPRLIDATEDLCRALQDVRSKKTSK